MAEFISKGQSILVERTERAVRDALSMRLAPAVTLLQTFHHPSGMQSHGIAIVVVAMAIVLAE